MLLACDIGNSRIKAALFKKNKILKLKTFKEVESVIKFASGEKITEAAVCSVVPSRLDEFEKKFKKKFNTHPFIISKDSNFNLKIVYDTPDTLGIDRICSSEGALYLFRSKNISNDYDRKTLIISIDFGTATTINIIKYKNIFIGGLIMPGLEMMFDVLKRDTAQLPKTNSKDYKNIIGRSTKSSIASGVINSTLGAIDRIIKNFKKNRRNELFIYITGGNAKLILPFLNFNYSYEKGLVLYGIKSIYEKAFKISNPNF